MSYVLYTVFLLICLQSQWLAMSISRTFYHANTTVQITLTPVNIRNTSVLMCLDTLAPVPMSYGQFGTGAEVLLVRTVSGPKCPYTIRIRVSVRTCFISGNLYSAMATLNFTRPKQCIKIIGTVQKVTFHVRNPHFTAVLSMLGIR